MPKTNDNDLYGTEGTVGFDTAVTTAMEALDKLHTTAESHHRVLVIELMGRHAGWIALAAGVAGGADVILLPEIRITWTWSPIRSGSATTAVQSSAWWWWRKAACRSAVRPSTRRSVTWRCVPAGRGREVVAAQLRRMCHADVRVTVLGHLQRGGSPSAFDRLLATRFGAGRAHDCPGQGGAHSGTPGRAHDHCPHARGRVTTETGAAR